jgi:hypothetical protein
MRTAVAVTAIFCLAAPIAAPVAAQEHAHDPSHMSSDGKAPAGWSMRLDDPKAKATDVKSMVMGTTTHVITGPAHVMWKTGETASGNFNLSAKFSMEKAPAHPEGYGLVLSGTNMDKDDQSYLYFLVRHDGKFMIKHRAGNDLHSIVEWTENAAIAEPGADGKSTNVLAVDVTPTAINYMVNGKTVQSFARNQPMTAEGAYGVRINHNLDLHIADFTLRRN